MLLRRGETWTVEQEEEDFLRDLVTAVNCGSAYG